MSIVVNARFLTQRMTGVQRYAAELSKRLRERVPDVRFVAPKNILNTKLATELGAEAFGTTSGHVWEQVELPRFLRRQCGYPLLLSLANTGPLKYENQLVVIHDISTIRHPESYSRRFGSLYRYLLPRLARRCTDILTVSHYSKSEIAKVLDVDHRHIHVVHDGVDQIFQPFKQNSREQDPYVLAVSSIAPHKNLTRLIEAFSYLDVPGMKLKIVGARASSFSGTRIDAQLMKNIEFTGYVSDSELVRLYQGARLFVFPSLYEGFGLPPLEAMACGCPCAVSNAASLPEVCGDAAIYFDPADSIDMARVIHLLLSNRSLCESLCLKGLEHVLQFTWETSVDRLISIIKKVRGVCAPQTFTTG